MCFEVPPRHYFEKFPCYNEVQNYGDDSCDNVQLTTIWSMAWYTVRDEIISHRMTGVIWNATRLCSDIVAAPNISFGVATLGSMHEIRPITAHAQK